MTTDHVILIDLLKGYVLLVNNSPLQVWLDLKLKLLSLLYFYVKFIQPDGLFVTSQHEYPRFSLLMKNLCGRRDPNSLSMSELKQAVYLKYETGCSIVLCPSSLYYELKQALCI